MLHHYYLQSNDLGYSGNRNNYEQETYMLLQDSGIPDLESQYHDIQEITETSNRGSEITGEFSPPAFFAFHKF